MGQCLGIIALVILLYNIVADSPTLAVGVHGDRNSNGNQSSGATVSAIGVEAIGGSRVAT